MFSYRCFLNEFRVSEIQTLARVITIGTNSFAYLIIINIMIIKKCWHCKAGRERFIPDQPS